MKFHSVIVRERENQMPTVANNRNDAHDADFIYSTNEIGLSTKEESGKVRNHEIEDKKI